MSMDRLFLDANVLFSAAYRADAGLTKLWDLKDVALMTSPYSAEEARINLGEPEQRRRLATLLQRVTVIGGMSSLPASVKLPEKDRPILQAALYAGATHLLTGDRQHFGPYSGRSIRGVLILLPAQYLHERKS